ncbi:hypothetical protein [Nocardioides aurantiacus]|uniref:Uncharacterized protein n=1 Tax=Nocardioides aurantiacus TaxID=86796 RepID=A0A3N2CPG1_9ACTN|nr:hypothetical protein [Nocardioides aurantiacus]ROR89328.1 hypothetical protein EDD33_0148 [Nocardioides aurantiacus]
MARQGYSVFSDLMRTTADGRNLNDLFAELNAVAAIHNEQQANFLSLFTQTVTTPVTSVLQTVAGSEDIFEEASEFGIAKSSRTLHDVLDMGATFKWYDARWAATWRYLADATTTEVQANANAIIAADQDNLFGEVMRTVFSPTNRKVTDTRTNAVYDVFAFANGDGWTPPTYAGNSFNGTHTHFRTTGAAALNSGDLDEAIDDLKSHGYSQENGTQVVLFVNATEGNRCSTFRVADGARADFIPAQGARFYTEGALVGDQPAASFAGFPVKGAYDDALIIETSRIPAGYLVALASGGALANTNPIMLRRHPRFPGLTPVSGGNADYPLVDSYWTTGFGTGVRHRLAGLVMQVSANPTYAPPALYVA